LAGAARSLYGGLMTEVFLALLLAAQPPPRATLSATPRLCDFGTVLAGAPVTCSFTIRNDGDAPARVSGAELARPLRLARTPAVIAPGQHVQVTLELPTSGLDGTYEGAMTLHFAEGGPSDLVLSTRGSVRQPMAFVPAAAFFLGGHAGESTSQSIEIVNQEIQPVEIIDVSPAPDGTDLQLETLEKGRRYRLTLTLRQGGPTGQKASDIVVRTTSAVRPSWNVRVNTWRRARVYTFPDSVDMGAIPLASLAATPERFAQTLMVYQRGGESFDARFSLDTKALSVSAVRGPRGDRFQATLTYSPAALAPGPVTATLIIETNDPEFPRLEVPVRGTVLATN